MARGGAAAKRVEDGVAAQRLNEVAGLLTLAGAIFVLVSLISFQPGQIGQNLGGALGYGLSSLLTPAFGRAAYVMPALLVLFGIRVFRRGLSDLSVSRGAAALAMLLSVSIVFGLFLGSNDVVRAGGWFGGFVSTILRESSGALGAYVVAGALLMLSVMFMTGSTLQGGAGSAAGHLRAAARRLQTRRAVTESVPVITNRKRDPVFEGPGPVIVLRNEVPVTSDAKNPRRLSQPLLPFAANGYQIPPLNLLDTPRHSGLRVDEEALRKSSEILEAKLANFGIEGKVVAVRPGPVITTFEIEPAPGVKVNRIVTLQDDLAMALRALGVRILAPVPGKAVVGIEVANSKREQVFLKEILESESFARSSSTLTLALGKDSAGNPVASDLARMPHLLLAGATGTGKSVSINAMIMSILCKATPHDVRFVMIDMKMLELSLYEDLPHLLVPVVTEPKKAVVVLKNLVEQMDARYMLLKEKGVRNIDSYNRVIEEEGGGAEDVIELTEFADAESERQVDDEAEPADVSDTTQAQTGHQHLPKIVVIIDELADLMMSSGRDVEEPITRLAQKARAAGIHMICATQRPSVDVITGLIKANFPARISFQVTARVDSRTILDSMGAERLLGGGDLLFMPPGTARLQRLHGAFVSEAEIRKVANFVRRQATPQYALELLEGEEDERGTGADDEYDDDMYDQAVRLVTETRQASISWVQRRLRVGYNRAARMVERMEREGVVSTSENGKPREVLAQRIED